MEAIFTQATFPAIAVTSVTSAELVNANSTANSQFTETAQDITETESVATTNNNTPSEQRGSAFNRVADLITLNTDINRIFFEEQLISSNSNSFNNTESLNQQLELFNRIDRNISQDSSFVNPQEFISRYIGNTSLQSVIGSLGIFNANLRRIDEIV